MNVFDLFAKITLDDSEYKKGLDDAGGSMGEFADKLKSGLATAEKVGAAALTAASGAVVALTKSAVENYGEYEQLVGGVETLFKQSADVVMGYAENAYQTARMFAKVGAAALTAASGAVVALTKSAVENYGEYEQLVGGVETLFKQSADVVMGYAENAYQTAGMSANEYMETVTSFSASLLQSMGGDTEAAAEKANLAITDMADNANKMGSSMESIQNAYQGFAKMNYTMLDNLKLGRQCHCRAA